MKFTEFLVEADELSFRIARAEERLANLMKWNKNGDHDVAIRTLRERIAELKQERSKK